jgi:hypothetical protein
MSGDVLLSGNRIALSPKSGATPFKVYGARSAEDLLDTTKRKLLQVGTLRPYQREGDPVKVRAPYMAIVVGPALPGKTWAIEAASDQDAPRRGRSGVGV